MSWGKRHYARFEGDEGEADEDDPQEGVDIDAEVGQFSGGGTPVSANAPAEGLSGSGTSLAADRLPPADDLSGNGARRMSPARSHPRSPSGLGLDPSGPQAFTIGHQDSDPMDAVEEVEAVDEVMKSFPAGEATPSAAEKKPVEVVKERKLASNSKTFINSLTCFIGSATYTLPACFQNIGLIGGTAMLAFSAVISLHCMFLLVDCRNYLETAQQKRIKTYGDLGFYTFGVLGARLVDTFIMLTQFGFCVCYMIVVSQTVHQMFPEVTKKLCIYMMVPLLVRASWLKSLRSLAKVSLVAEIGMFLSLAMVMFYIMHRMLYGAWDAHLDKVPHHKAPVVEPRSELVLFNIFGMTNFFGVSICVFEGVGMVLPVYNSMKKPDSFKPIWGGTMALVTAIYMFFGAFGYMAYRPDIDDIILANLPHIPLTIVVKLCFCVGLYLTYPLMLFPVIEIMEEMGGRTSIEGASLMQTLSWNSARSMLVISTGVLAMYIPKLNLFIALIGASGSTMLAFVLPTCFKLKLRWSDMTRFERCREAACLVIGLAGGSVSTIAAVSGLREAYIQEAISTASGRGL